MHTNPQKIFLTSDNMHFLRKRKENKNKHLGPVVQSIVSLTCSLSVNYLSILDFITKYTYLFIYFVQQKILEYLRYLKSLNLLTRSLVLNNQILSYRIAHLEAACPSKKKTLTKTCSADADMYTDAQVTTKALFVLSYR